LSNWKDATELPTCPMCQEQRLVEKVKDAYFCQVCSWTWPVNPLAPVKAPALKGTH